MECESAMAYVKQLREEGFSTEQIDRLLPKLEEVAALREEDLEQLGQDFIASAAKHKGTLDSFLNKLEVLQTLTTEGVFAFDLDALNAYLSEYKAAGYLAVSHSEQYRQAYKPAYRILCIQESK
jgi:uncharacterized protein (DUF885 family)